MTLLKDFRLLVMLAMVLMFVACDDQPKPTPVTPDDKPAAPVYEQVKPEQVKPEQAKPEQVKPEPPDSFLTPSKATLDFESRAEKIIQSRYEQRIQSDPKFIEMRRSGLNTSVTVTMTKNYEPDRILGEYTGNVNIVVGNPENGREQSVAINCWIDEVVQGGLFPKFEGDHTSGYLWACGDRFTRTLWDERGHFE